MEMYFICCCTWIMAIVFSKAKGTTNLTLPTSVNCGDQAVLTCISTECNVGAYRFIRDGVTVYNISGPQTGADPARYSATVTSASQVLLTITNITLSDAGAYQCTCGFDEFSAQQTLRYECKAVSSTAFVNTQKKIIISIDGLYPRPSRIDTPLINHTSQLPGSYLYWSSTTLADHYLWVWYSNASLPDGNHGYNITVITGTQVSLVSGYFKIVTPTSPTISNISTIDNNRQVLRGVQDTPLTIQCVSSGGIPAPTLAWYRGNTSTSPLVQSSTSDPVPQSDGTYTVTLNHSFTPSRRDDMMTFLCRVFYPGAITGASPDPSPASAILYLDSPPSTPTITDLSFVAGQVKLTVVPGYHGGLNQTIVVQTSTDHKTWHNSSSVNVGKVPSHTTLEISNLQANNLNYVRAYAFNSEGQSQNYSAVLNVAVKQDEGTYCSSISSTLAVSVSTTAFITIILGIVANVIVFRRYPNRIMRILQHTCPGNVPKGNETNTVMQSQTSTGLERQIVFSTIVASENPTRGENVGAAPTYESLNQTRNQPVYTSLEATAEQRNTYENLKRQ